MKRVQCSSFHHQKQASQVASLVEKKHGSFACCIDACRQNYDKTWEIQKACIENFCKNSMEHAKFFQNFEELYKVL